MKIIRRLFRICGVNRTLPTGTLAIVERVGESPLFEIHVAMDDNGRTPLPPVRTVVLTDSFSVSDLDDRGEGTVLSNHDTDEKLWFYYRELPVTANRIIQTVSAINVNAKV